MGAPSRFVQWCEYGSPQNSIRSQFGPIRKEGEVRFYQAVGDCQILNVLCYLSSSSGRTLLLFVIRDHIGSTPLANLQATITSDLLRLWEGLSKPSDLKDQRLSDYFDLEFTTLPHKLLVPDKFDADVQLLRKRFVDKGSPDYLFKPAYHKWIPADGVSFYMEGIWVRVLYDIIAWATR